MAFPKEDAAAQALFEELLPDEDGVARRPMFGHTGAFLNGQLFMGTFGEDVLLRLDEKSRAELLEHKGAKPFEPMKGRPMREYIIVPRSFRDRIDVAREWLERSLAYVRTLPPKKPKPRKKR